MDLNYDYHEFQRDTMDRLAQIYAESLNEENDIISEEVYNKIQKILNCKEMEKCHPFLYTLDRLHLNDVDLQKVNKLYECGVQRGFIEENTEDDPLETTECLDDCDDTPLCGGPSDSLTDQSFDQTNDQVSTEPKPTFNIIYSASKDGVEKSGEFYSNKYSKDEARIDCLKQLQSQGYNNINVMAIEQNVDGVNQEVKEEPAGENLYDMYQEDDSSEYEKQETGDTSSNTKPKVTQKKDNGSTEDSESDNSEDTTETSDDDSETSEDTPEDDSKKDEDTEEDTENTEEKTDDSEQDSSEEDTSDSDDDDDDDDKSTEEEPEEDEKKLTAEEKENLRGEYSKIFKEVLTKMETEKSVSEMTIQEKLDFLTKLQEKWTKNDPTEFMKTKDQETLDKFVAKPEEKEEK